MLAVALALVMAGCGTTSSPQPRSVPLPVAGAGSARSLSSRSHPEAVPAGSLGSYQYASLTDPAARRRCVATVAEARGPLLVVVGASFAAGVGARTPAAAWAVDLAQRLGWRALVVGVPGVGYIHVGLDRIGPLSAVTSALHLASLHPSLVVVQAGHDDWRSPPWLERRAVEGYYRRLRRVLPRARVATITVFESRRAPATARERLAAINRSILAGVGSEPGVVVMDPFLHRWHFGRSIAGRLHPSALGDRQLAARVLSDLEAHHIRPAPLPSGSHPVCSLVVPQVIAASHRPHSSA